ncbi:malto-oligosyltrehalose synthase [Umezakia ovalisporum]|uniref:Malto-oligosyltrehalose synthase n=2 Tax=Umezakia ovalisporum TaxID=75695 RepID=A0AA43GYW3_9CYAN|nr:malto-oligosyltrehalose synthase [Umezakia ovalisporum]MDH6057570.1 malto-oligosyltrehalose synthase [Umezakia ovalisporum FSS-43]MDH6063453.1 malto-oligosyltrehalose synthase [Umezakia ovalisporum FSS-62]MDH6072378.1 malto-oligosyltrehalose synthase [Umezakia ovalisporum CobakiLakeA]MDH6075840.1 malto-oligosyltrehalose synthase [Umezakia ovalisporum CS-1034]MDH6078638.1 malto-oligosyltrehalose synthase [Umezakia ovalisporum FSS-45]
MRIPTATYRIQFNSKFGFNEAKKIINYLDELGISDLYASPIFKARIGSTHGYDIVDPNQLNPELGTQEDFSTLVQQIKQHHMGWLQDIVPNHMAYDSQNQYLMDVLENGVNSVYANYFDIAWNNAIINGFGDSQQPVLAPLLGNFYGASLENGEIKLKYDQHGLSVNYYDLRFPIKLESYAIFLNYNIGKLSKILGRNNPIFVRLLGILYMVKHIPADVTPKERQDQVNFVKGLLWEIYTDNTNIQGFIDENLRIFNGEPGKPDTFNLLDNLLSEQFFRLAFWKVGAEEINYRRFFTINELISLNIENYQVFCHTHALAMKLVKENQITGLRIDHIDGLYNPSQYLQTLRQKTGDTYITVEKILHSGEDLPNHWSIQGTTGYDFLNYLNGIFCQTAKEKEFTQIYWNVTGFRTAYEQLAIDKKHLILERNLAGDVDNLTYILKKIASRHRYGNDFTINGLKRALAEVLTLFPIYRTYTNQNGILPADRRYIQDVIQQAKSHLPLLHHELNFIEKLLLLEYENSLTTEDQEQWLYFVMRLQQYTGPLMAKGVEDTALYVYNRFISLNEVGGNPDNFGISITDFHNFNQHRKNRWLHSMNTTSTHDTKRGEDIRARLNVLSEIPEEWQKQVYAFYEINRVHKTSVSKSLPMPDTNDEYQFYQMLIGAFPFFEHEYSDFCQRIQDYVLKAVREAKVYTAWLRPNATYEQALTKFVAAVLENSDQNQFLQEFLPFQKRVAYYGIFNSLSQTLLKITSPGVPDFYQGTDLWDFSMVDPDNRRPVDFQIRQSHLKVIKKQSQEDILKFVDELLATKEDSRIKLFVIVQALKARKENLTVFQQGDYLPLEAKGKYSDHIIAFARIHSNQTIITIAPRFFTSLIEPGEYPLDIQVWDDTYIHLPPAAPSLWQNTITQQTLYTDKTMLIGEALKHFPVALLKSHD